MKNDYPAQTTHDSDDEIDLMEIFSILLYHKYTIFISAFIGLLLGVLYALSASPVYQADALLQVDEKNGSSLSSLLGGESFLGVGGSNGLATEVELLRSRQIVGKTIESLQLNTTINVDYFPLFGKLAHSISGSPDPVLILSQFSVPERMIGEDFTLRAQTKGQYELIDADGQVHTGKVGVPLNFGSGVLQVKALDAKEGQSFTLNQSSFLLAVDEFQQRLSVSNKGKQTSLLNVQLTGKDPQETADILNTLLKHYLDFDKAQQARTAANGLAFIASELPRLNATLTVAENKLNQYRKEKGSLDLTVQSADMVKRLTDLEMQIVALKTQQAGLSEIYTAEHPAYREVSEKLTALQESKQQIEQQIASLPDVQQDVIRLTREVETNQAVYIQLLNKQQELNLVKAGSVGKAQIIDPAVATDKPIKPKKKIIVLLTGFLATFLAMAFVLLREMLSSGIQDSETLENAGIAVLAEVPAHQEAEVLNRKRHAPLRFLRRVRNRFANRIETGHTGLLAITHPTGATVESIRALRTTLLFSFNSAPNRVLLVTGPTPGVGKTFISSNLAVVMAQIHKKVLLIDADMRKGLVHEAFHLRAHHGLAEVLSGKMDTAQAIQTTQTEGLSVLSRGALASNSTELLTSSAFAQLLSWAQEEYDYVILDTPPVLLVSDALLMGRMAGVGVLVSGFGLSKLKEVETAIMRLKQAQVPMEGVVLNNVTKTAKNHSHYGTYYGEYNQKS